MPEVGPSSSSASYLPVASMLFSKFPILLLSMWLFNLSFMAPNPPPDKSERVNGSFHERILPTLYPILHRASASIPCIAELVALLATRHPSSFSSYLLSHLVLPGHHLPTSRIDPYFLAGCLLVVIGALGRLWCFRALGRYFTHELAVRKDHALVMTGPYAIVRHPGYLCGAVGTLGMSFVIGGPGSIARRCGWLETMPGRLVIGMWVLQSVVTWVMCCVRSRQEDSFLHEHFREKWERYAQRVKYRMIQGVY